MPAPPARADAPRCGLEAAARLVSMNIWIRTFSSALDRRRFRGFVRVGTDLPAHRSSEQLPASAYRSSCRAAVRGAATHRPDQAASHHDSSSADGGSGSSRALRWREMDSNYWSRHGETPLGRAMWFPRTALRARRGTDPERDDKFESGFLQRRVHEPSVPA